MQRTHYLVSNTLFDLKCRLLLLTTHTILFTKVINLFLRFGFVSDNFCSHEHQEAQNAEKNEGKQFRGSKLRGMKVARSIRKINVADKLKSFRKRSSGGVGEDGGSRLGIRRKSKKFLAMVKKNLMSRPKLGGHRGGSKRNNSKNIIIIHNNTSITSNDEDNRSSCVEVKEIASLKEEDVTSIDSAPPTSSDSVLPPQDDQESLKEEQVVESDSESESESESESGFVEEDDFGIISFREDKASIHIQSVFRAHLARRAFRALKSLVKLQAVVRGVCVRRQARIALHCINTLARLQLKVQARQLRGGPNHAVAA